MNEQELTLVIDKAVQASIQKELGAYKVDKEQHYKDHIFLTELRQWIEGMKSNFWKGLVSAFVPAILLLLILGFITWMGIKVAVGK